MRWPFFARRSTTRTQTSQSNHSDLLNRFGFRLLDNLNTRDSGNVFISPYSALIAIAVAYEGATGETHRAIAGALGFSAAEDVDNGDDLAAISSSLPSSDDKTKILSANSLWCNHDFALSVDYRERMATNYGAEIASLDFTSTAAVERINRWVAEQTKHKIERVLDQVSPLAKLIAINAIYFKGTWVLPFDKRSTRPAPFTNAAGATKDIPMMFCWEHLRYFETSDFQAVALSYNGNRFTMYVFLPSARKSLAIFQQSLGSEAWQRWMRKFEPVTGKLKLPRFSLDYRASLMKSLSTMGMEVAFERERASFGAISPGTPRLWLDDVLHRAVVDVNEEGTEAAATTCVVVAAASPRSKPERTFEMIVDRPFFFAICDEQTVNIIFMGSVNDLG